MARRKRSFSRGSGSNAFNMKNILAGAGVANIGPRFGVTNPLLLGGIAYWVSGVPGVVGAIGPNMLSGLNGGSTGAW